MTALELSELYDMASLRQRAATLEREARGVRAAVGHCAEAAMRRRLFPQDAAASLLETIPQAEPVRNRVLSALRAWPAYSDRMLASLCGASPATVSRERRRSGTQAPARLGVDGRMRRIPHGLCAVLRSICPSIGAYA
jgi:hypothetical protein